MLVGIVLDDFFLNSIVLGDAYRQFEMVVTRSNLCPLSPKMLVLWAFRDAETVVKIYS